MRRENINAMIMYNIFRFDNFKFENVQQVILIIQKIIILMAVHLSYNN